MASYAVTLKLVLLCCISTCGLLGGAAGTYILSDSCLASIADAINISYADASNTNPFTSLQYILATKLDTCVQDNRTEVLRMLVPKGDEADDLQLFLDTEYRPPAGISITIVPMDSQSILAQVAYQNADPLVRYKEGSTGLIFRSAWTGTLMAQSTLESLGAMSDLDPAIQWSDILPFYRDYAVSWKGQVVSMPASPSALLMYYRADALEAKGLAVPTSWEELLAAAAAINGTDLNDDGQGDFGACVSTASACISNWVIPMLGSMVQAQGTEQGTLFDPVNMDPLVSNPAMARVLTLMQKLLLLSPPPPVGTATGCFATEAQFMSGNCAFSISHSKQFKVLSTSKYFALAKKVMVAQLPGSTSVLHRTAKRMVPCTVETCTVAAHNIQVGKGHAMPKVLLNRAPVPNWSTWLIGIDSRAAPQLKKVAYQMLTKFASQKVSLKRALNASSDTTPFRVSHLDHAPWVAAGYPAQLTRSFLDAVRVVTSTTNGILDLQIEGAHQFLNILEQHVAAFLTGQVDMDTAMRSMERDMGALVDHLGRQQLLAAYKNCLASIYGIKVPKHKASKWVKMVWFVVIPSVTTIVMVVLSVMGVMSFRRDARRTVFGRVMAPGGGNETSLVVTDIQDSTLLWESFPAEVMDRTLRLHHNCIRKALSKHLGYESATEGDSFIVAFHTPKDALLFCVEVQLMLLEVAWPDEILKHDLCRPIWLSEMNAQAVGAAGPDGTVRSGASGAEGDRSFVWGAAQSPRSASSPTADMRSNSRLLGEIAEVSHQALSFPYQTACQLAWRETTSSDPQRVLAFRGPRVRMGIHSGVEVEGVVMNTSEARTQYSGRSITVTKMVSDAAQGGMVVMSEATYGSLSMESLWQKVMVLHCGSHLLKDGEAPTCLYQVLDRGLKGRLALLGPVRSLEQVQLGALQAPLGVVTVVFMYMVGASTLLSWNSVVARRTIALFQDVAGRQLLRFSGYQVEAADNLLLAAFSNAHDALSWCLSTQSAALQLDWPQELLEHELGQEVVVQAPQEQGGGMRVVFRGPRIKAGVDTGEVRGSVHAMTGKITYRGKVMNRSSRIASTTTVGQVLCSSETCGMAYGREAVGLELAVGSVGYFRLKGVPEKVELFQCRLLQELEGEHTVDYYCPPVHSEGGSQATCSEEGSDMLILAEGLHQQLHQRPSTGRRSSASVENNSAAITSMDTGDLLGALSQSCSIQPGGGGHSRSVLSWRDEELEAAMRCSQTSVSSQQGTGSATQGVMPASCSIRRSIEAQLPVAAPVPVAASLDPDLEGPLGSPPS